VNGPAGTRCRAEALGAGMVGEDPTTLREREMRKTIKEAAPRPLAAETVVADYACWRDLWVES
jgi:hypothetical protein